MCDDLLSLPGENEDEEFQSYADFRAGLLKRGPAILDAALAATPDTATGTLTALVRALSQLSPEDDVLKLSDATLEALRKENYGDVMRDICERAIKGEISFKTAQGHIQVYAPLLENVNAQQLIEELRKLGVHRMG